MVVVEVSLTIVVLYLLAGACVGLRMAKDLEENLQRLIKEGNTEPGFIAGYKFGCLKAAFLVGPIIYAKEFFRIKR